MLKDRDAIWEFADELDGLSRELRGLAATGPLAGEVGGPVPGFDRGELRRIRAVVVLTKIRAMATALAAKVAEAG